MHAGKRAQQVLHHLEPRARRDEIRSIHRIHAASERRRNPHRRLEIAPNEHHARARRSGMQFDADLAAAPIAAAGHERRPTEGLLRPRGGMVRHDEARRAA